MKLFYNRKSSGPTYYAQQGFRNGNKTFTRNVRNFGKYSDLLKITDDPLAYVKEEIRKMNEEYRVGRVEYELKADSNEHVAASHQEQSYPTHSNVGYFFLQHIMSGLQLEQFFSAAVSGSKITFDCYTISRFLTDARILDPQSKLATWDTLDDYYEKPPFESQHFSNGKWSFMGSVICNFQAIKV